MPEGIDPEETSIGVFIYYKGKNYALRFVVTPEMTLYEINRKLNILRRGAIGNLRRLELFDGSEEESDGQFAADPIAWGRKMVNWRNESKETP